MAQRKKQPKKRDKVQSALDELALVRRDPTSEANLAQLKTALAHASNIVVADAAQIVSEFEIDSLGEYLAPAFARFMENPSKRDPQCRAKIALARALYKLHSDAEEVFRGGIRHRQLESVMGGKEDTAGELRAICALALVAGHYRDALPQVAELLADPDRNARTGAARAIESSGNADVGMPLLRFKVRSGEPDGQVLAACLGALLALDADTSIEFVTELLDHAEPLTREAAALALGESRLDRALAPLREWSERSMLASDRRVALVAIAMLRTKDAWDYLIELVSAASAERATQAANALAPYRYDQKLCERVLTAAKAREDRQLAAVLAEPFASG